MNTRPRSLIVNQVIVLGIAALVIGGLALLSLFEEVARLREQPSPEESLFFNTIIGMVERCASPLGIAVGGILGALFWKYRQLREAGENDEVRAAASFDRARLLECESKPKEALTVYEDVGRRYPHTAAGKDAVERIERLRF